MVIVALAGGLAMLWRPLSNDGRSAGSDSNAQHQRVSLNADDLREIADLPLVAAHLRERLNKSPADPDGWALLARSYARLGEHVNAGAAFQKALELGSEDATLLTDYADTVAFLNNRSFEGKPREMIERALRIDPANIGALMLAGLAAFDRREYVQAISYWEKAVSAAGTDSPVTAQALEGIKEARKRAGAPDAAITSHPPHPSA
jgi:cytochrome c-type biogenesis protein CcmH